MQAPPRTLLKAQLRHPWVSRLLLSCSACPTTRVWPWSTLPLPLQVQVARLVPAAMRAQRALTKQTCRYLKLAEWSLLHQKLPRLPLRLLRRRWWGWTEQTQRRALES